MTIEKFNTPYEILYRLNEDGSVGGCHRRELETIKDTVTGEVYSVKEVGPFPIEGADMDAVLGEINTSLSLGISQRDQTIAGLEGSLQQAINSNHALTQEKSDLQSHLTQRDQIIAGLEGYLQQAIDGNQVLTQEKSDLQDHLTQRDQIIADLQSQLVELNAQPE